MRREGTPAPVETHRLPYVGNAVPRDIPCRNSRHGARRRSAPSAEELTPAPKYRQPRCSVASRGGTPLARISASTKSFPRGPEASPAQAARCAPARFDSSETSMPAGCCAGPRVCAELTPGGSLIESKIEKYAGFPQAWLPLYPLKKVQRRSFDGLRSGCRRRPASGVGSPSMDRKSTKSNGECDADFATAGGLRSRRTPPVGCRTGVPNRSSNARSELTSRLCRSEIVPSRGASKCGMRFAGLLGRKFSRPAARRVNEETAT
jgi:hypothetical protein